MTWKTVGLVNICYCRPWYILELRLICS